MPDAIRQVMERIHEQSDAIIKLAIGSNAIQSICEDYEQVAVCRAVVLGLEQEIGRALAKAVDI
ncbi:MAG TPA: hypothetical protein VFO41_13690 [Alphaproteobacteria bacterium]|nr:hypothetical protein [Alphaproteobacteria bacterium]